MKRMLKSKRGFTLAEAVVAIAIIVIVSVSTLTLVISSNRATQKALYTAQAQNFVSDVVSIYRTTDSESELKNGVSFALGQTVDNLEEIVLRGNYKAKITIEGAKLTVTVMDGTRKIASAEYVKGEVTP